MLTLLQILLIGLNLRNGLIFLNISVFTEWHTNYSQKTSIAALEVEFRVQDKHGFKILQ